MHHTAVESAAGTTHLGRAGPGQAGPVEVKEGDASAQPPLPPPPCLLPRHQSIPPTHGTCAPASPGCCGRRVGGGENPAGCGAQRGPLLGAAAVKNKSTCNMKESLQFTRGSGTSEGRGLGSLAAECRKPRERPALSDRRLGPRHVQPATLPPHRHDAQGASCVSYSLYEHTHAKVAMTQRPGETSAERLGPSWKHGAL